MVMRSDIPNIFEFLDSFPLNRVQEIRVNGVLKTFMCNEAIKRRNMNLGMKTEGNKCFSVYRDIPVVVDNNLHEKDICIKIPECLGLPQNSNPNTISI